mmetsp:Transcript_70965/g.169314  ORF Transcript_70965/g.169314 Transcript_70965/m.169314 type:complete len:202 (-) Transcript_70965:260-865(-)
MPRPHRSPPACLQHSQLLYLELMSGRIHWSEPVRLFSWPPLLQPPGHSAAGQHPRHQCPRLGQIPQSFGRPRPVAQMLSAWARHYQSWSSRTSSSSCRHHSNPLRQQMPPLRSLPQHHSPPRQAAPQRQGHSARMQRTPAEGQLAHHHFPTGRHPNFGGPSAEHSQLLCTHCIAESHWSRRRRKCLRSQQHRRESQQWRHL